MAALLIGTAVIAQAPADVPSGHWAYPAVSSLAAKGLVKGYPADGKFLGGRTVTRYEMAALIQRVVSKVEELAEAAAGKQAPAPLGDVVRPAQLEELRKLVSEFRVELTVIGTDLAKVQAELGEIRGQVAEARSAADKAGETAGSALARANEAKTDIDDIKENMSLTRTELDALTKDVKSHKLSGYLQARFEDFDTGQGSLFPATGATGGPAVGGPNNGFLVRRARLKFSGPVTPRASYVLQLDAGSTGAAAVKDAYITVADMPVPAKAVMTFGLFAPSFGVELPASSSTRESPERALGFSDSSASATIFKGVLPMFNGQDRDNGVQATWNLPNTNNPSTKFTLGLFNGEGRGAAGVRNQNKQLDSVARAETALLDGKLDLGVSGYYGAVAAKDVATAAAPNVNAYRMLLGADMRYFLPWGSIFRAEYAGGVYELTPDRSLYLQGNHAYAWLAQIKHPLSKRLDFALKYDEFAPVSQVGKSFGGLGRADLIRKTLGGGFLYYLDEATRFRLWYAKGLTPYDPTATGVKHSRLGLITAEMQITY